MMMLATAVLVSALLVVHTKYRSRLLFSEIQRLEQELDATEVEWGQLQLEQKTWAEHGRIEELATLRLGMIQPPRDAIIYIKP